MRKVMSMAALVLAAALAAMPMLAQEAAKKAEAPKPAAGPSQALLDEWNDIGRRIIAIAEDMPEDKYDYKPKPEMRSWLGQLVHAAQGNYFFINPVLGKPLPQDDPPREQFKNKADVVAFVKKSFEEGAAIIKAKGDAGMGEAVQMGKQMYRVDALAYDLIAHANEHYGQIVVYYRLNGLVPPESRPKK